MCRIKYFVLTILGAATVMVCGCGAGSVNAVSGGPTAVGSPVTPQVSTGATGVDMGGHAPLVGAHIYLVQLGAPTSSVTQTYGSVVKNLLTIDGSAATTGVYSGTPPVQTKYPRTQNGSWTNSGYASDQFVPSTDLVGLPFYGVTTNQYGEFYLNGDYVCDAGYPVMLIGYGGSPSYNGSGPNVFAVSSATLSGNGTTATITYTTSTPQLFYTGEPVTVTGLSPAVFNQTGTVLASGLTSTTFKVSVSTTTTSATSTGTGSVTGTPSFNPAATNMAMAGLCPSTGNFNGVLNYIYMNEVSTTAAAFALAQFTNTAATGQSGYDEFHIGAPVANLAGLQNAAVTAGLLYDIQGGNSGSTSFAGENHTARTTTPCPSSGTCAVGTVPNSQINTIGNSLAACVDSNNTYYWSGTYVAPTASNQSTACKTLFQYAEDNGYYDTSAPTHYAFNIAQAAFSLARFPEGLGTATTSGSTNGGVQTLTAGTSTTASNFVSAIYGLPAGSNVPFAPALSSAPNDWSVAIQWNPSGAANNVAGAAYTDVEIDRVGVAYALSGSETNAGSGGTNVYALTPATTPLGGMNLTTYTTGGLSRALTSGLAIDASNNVWAPGLTGIYKFTPPTTAGVQVGSITADGGAIAVDSALNQYVPSGNDGQDTAVLTGIFKQNSAGTAASGFPIQSVTAGCPYGVGWTTLDSTGNIWTGTSVNNALGTTNYVCRYANTGGTAQFTFALPNNVTGQAGAAQGTSFAIARGLATDKNDNAWFAEKNQDALYMVAKGSTSNTYTLTNTQHYVSGGRLSAPRGVAVDGANTIWVSSTGDTTAIITGGTSTPKYATGLAQFSDTDVAITPSYITGASAVSSSTSNTSLASVAIDPSGNVWSAQGSQTPGSTGTVNPTLVYEYVGLATPTTTPIAYAKANGLVAAKPGLTSGAASVFRYPAGDVPALGSCPTASLAIGFSGSVTFTVGETLLLSGFQTSTYLNGHMVQVCAAGGATLGTNNIRATFVDGYVPVTSATTNEAGAVSAVN